MRVLAVVIAMLGVPAAAQEMPGLAETIAQIDGIEVQATGKIGYLLNGEEPSFKTDNGQYRTQLAVDRETLRALESCSMRPGGPTCTADISAEIEAQGPYIKLIVFDIRNLRQE